MSAKGGVGIGSRNPGSGGAIRLVADAVNVEEGSVLSALNGYDSDEYGNGRIRIEANSQNIDGDVSPGYSYALPGPIFPPSDAPKVYATLINGSPVPADPWGGFGTLYWPDVEVATSGQKLLEIQAENVPLDWLVDVRVGNIRGDVVWYEDAVLTGSFELSGTSVLIDIADGISALHVRAHAPEN